MATPRVIQVSKGARGAAGATGATGATGTAGTNGTDGADGVVGDATFEDHGTVTTGTETLSRANATVIHKITAGGNFTIAVENWPASGTYGETLIQLVNGGAHTITWPVEVTWLTGSGSAPTLRTSGTDFIVLVTTDSGATVYGRVSGDNSFTGTHFSPATDDGASLGQSVSLLRWSDAYFATGAVINFSDGAERIIHADNQINFVVNNTNPLMRLTNTGMVLVGSFDMDNHSIQSVSTLDWGSGTTDTTLTRSSAQVLTVEGGVIPGHRIATTTTPTSLSNSSTAAQNIFAAANDVLTVLGSKTYRFRAVLQINTGNTTHTTSFGLALTTATLTDIVYTSSATSSAADTLATPQMRRVSTNNAAALTATSVAVTTNIVLEGMFRVGTAGSITPQITFDAGPGGTCEIATDSFFECWPIGADTFASAGAWA
jgi:hypothetical protein